MNKELYGKLLKISEYLEDYYSHDWDDLYYHDIASDDYDIIYNRVITYINTFMIRTRY